MPRNSSHSTKHLKVMCAVFGVLAATVALPAGAGIANAQIPFAESNYEQGVKADNPIAYWPLDEPASSGVASDLQNVAPGTIEGGVTPGVDQGLFAGTTATRFDGAPCSGVNVNGAAVQLAPSGAVSVEAWVFNPSATSQTVFRWRTFGYHLGVSSSFAEFDGAPWGSVGISNLTLADGKWHHVVGERDTSTMSVYVDGKLAASGVPSQGMVFGANNEAAIGRDGSACDGVVPSYQGDLGHVAVYRYALSTDQVRNHYQLGGLGISTNLTSGPGHVLNGSPKISLSSDVADFSDRDYTLDSGKYNAVVNWGDATATSAGVVNCVMPPPPGPAPGSPPPLIQCTVSATHDFAKKGAYPVRVDIYKNDGQHVQASSEALIFQRPSEHQIRSSIGELMAFNGDVKNKYEACTATVIHSATKNVIVTAAHCVADGQGRLYDHFRFAPGFDGTMCPDLNTTDRACVHTKTPFGVWSAGPSDIAWEPDYPSNQRLDFAFITLHPYRDTGVSAVEDAVGGVSLKVNAPYAQAWTAYGYPIEDALPDTNAGTQTVFFRKCGGDSFEYNDPKNASSRGPENIVMDCRDPFIKHPGNVPNPAFGASGGPWFNDDQHLLSAVNKGYISGQKGSLEGAYLANEASADFLRISLP